VLGGSARAEAPVSSRATSPVVAKSRPRPTLGIPGSPWRSRLSSQAYSVESRQTCPKPEPLRPRIKILRVLQKGNEPRGPHKPSNPNRISRSHRGKTKIRRQRRFYSLYSARLAPPYPDLAFDTPTTLAHSQNAVVSSSTGGTLILTASDGRHPVTSARQATAANALPGQSRMICWNGRLMSERRLKKDERSGLRSGSSRFIAADCGRAPVEEVAAAGDAPPPGQRTAARSPARFDTTISRLGPPGPGDSARRLQALVSGLQPPAVAQTVDGSSQEPAGSLPRQRRMCAAAAPKSPGQPGRYRPRLPICRLVLVRTERLSLRRLTHDCSFAPTPRTA
jgi:hypothetical protein